MCRPVTTLGTAKTTLDGADVPGVPPIQDAIIV